MKNLVNRLGVTVGRAFGFVRAERGRNGLLALGGEDGRSWEEGRFSCSS